MPLPWILGAVLQMGAQAVLGGGLQGGGSRSSGGGGRAGARVVWGADTITPTLSAAEAQAHGYLSTLTQHYTLRTEAYAKTKAPWTDRSGNARSGLTAVGDSAQRGGVAAYGIELTHRAPYGIWLETRHSGRFAIINHAINDQAPQFFNAAEQVFAKMFGR